MDIFNTFSSTVSEFSFTTTPSSAVRRQPQMMSRQLFEVCQNESGEVDLFE